MDIYSTRCFVTNKVLLTYNGLWPEAKGFKKYISRTLFTIFTFTMSIPSIIGLYVDFGHNFDKVIEHLCMLCNQYMALFKMITTIVAQHDLKFLYNEIVQNMNSIKNEGEKRIIDEYSEKGRFLTVLYLIYMFSSCAGYVFLPLFPVLLDIIIPLDHSRHLEPIAGGEFPFDVDEHFKKVYLFQGFYVYFAVFVTFTIDTMYVVCVEHCLGLFAIVRYRLKICTNHQDFTSQVEQNNQCNWKTNAQVYDFITETIKLHKKCIRFTDVLEQAYSTSFLISMGLNTLYNSTLTIFILTKTDNPVDGSRYSIVLLGELIHLFYLSLPGQKLINDSSNILENTYSNEWYNIPVQSQKLLQLMALRSTRPCQLTAGKIYIINFSNFAMLVKASITYITVFVSFRSH